MTQHNVLRTDIMSSGDSHASFEAIAAEDRKTPLLLLCDHASNHIPAEYDNLGLADDQLQRHIAYDPGAEAVTRLLSARFGCGAVLGQFSRLLIDPNRGEDDPTMIMRIADRAVVPGNRQVDERERERRLVTFYRPYHAAVGSALDDMIERGIAPILISIHSFTESWRGNPRPWHVSALWDQDRRIAQPLVVALRCFPDWVVGENEPYSGTLEGDTMWKHGTKRNIPHALIEV